MSPNPQCAALAAAKTRSGLSYAQIAEKIGTSEKHVVDICTGVNKPTPGEFKSLANVLNITDTPPQDKAHSTA